MKKNLLKILALSLSLSMMTPMTAGAQEIDKTESVQSETTENIDEESENDETPDVSQNQELSNDEARPEIDENGVVSGIYYEEESVFESAGASTEEALQAYNTEGDGLDGDIVEVQNLTSSEENNCQLTINADLPEGFDANIYVQLKNYDNGKIYQYTLLAVNDFAQRGYIPDGDYRVIECSVYDDVNSSFPFNAVEDFSLKYGEVKSVSVSLKDEQAAMQLISERLHTELEDGTEDLSEFTVSDFEVTSDSTGTGRMAVTGAQKQSMVILAKIKEGGRPGYATVDISLDDGLTFNMQDVEIPYSGMVSLDGAGVTLVFEVEKKSVQGEIQYGNFNPGDTFRCVLHDPTAGVEYGGKYKGNSKMELVDEDPDASIFERLRAYNIPSVRVDVIKSGTLGDAVIRYSLDGTNFSDEMVVPSSGYWQVEGTTLSIGFYTTVGDVYLNAEDYYTAEPYEETQNGLFGILTAIAVLFAGGAIAIWYYFKKQIIPQSVYTIHEYKPVRKQPKSGMQPVNPQPDKKGSKNRLLGNKNKK